MRLSLGYTDPFLSPVSGRLPSSYQLPDLPLDYIFLGNQENRADLSPALIDVRLDIIELRRLMPLDTSDASFLLQKDDKRLPKAQSLQSLKGDGLLKTLTHALSLAIPNKDYLTPDLDKDKIWIGEENNKAVQKETISVTNLPNLTYSKVWQGDIRNRPVEVSLDFVKPNLTYKHLWIGDSSNKPKESLTISVSNLPSLTKGKVWQGDTANRPIEVTLDVSPADATYILQKPNLSLTRAQALSELVGLSPRILKASLTGVIEVAVADQDYATKATLERIKAETQAFRDEAQQAAQRAAASATEATGAAEEATGAAAEASAAAGEASGAAAAASGSALAAGISALAASGSASSASSSAGDAQDRANEAKKSAESAGASAGSAASSLATLLATGLNALPNHGDVNFQGFRGINAASPIETSDLANKKYVDAAVAGGHIPINMGGFVQGLEGADGKLFAKRGEDCLLNLIPAGGDVDLGAYKLINLGEPLNQQDGTTKGYVDAKFASFLDSLKLSGFVTGKPSPDGQIVTTRGETCLLNLIPAGGDVDLGSYKLMNLGTPIKDQDAATKAYVDNAISGGGIPVTMTGFVEGKEGVDGHLLATRGETCLLSAIPAGGDVDMGLHKLINLQEPLQKSDAATKNYVDSAISGDHKPIRLTGFVEGFEGKDGELPTTRGPTCLLTNIPAGGDVDMGGYRLKNLRPSPVEEDDAVSMAFLWDILHDEVNILWP